MLIDQGHATSQQNDPNLWILQNNTYMCPDYLKGLPEEEQKDPLTKTKAK